MIHAWDVKLILLVKITLYFVLHTFNISSFCIMGVFGRGQVRLFTELWTFANLILCMNNFKSCRLQQKLFIAVFFFFQLTCRSLLHYTSHTLNIGHIYITDIICIKHYFFTAEQKALPMLFFLIHWKIDDHCLMSQDECRKLLL